MNLILAILSVQLIHASIENDNICPICLEDLSSESSGEIIKASCTHCFHTECLDKWLREQITCPCCRTKIRTRSDLMIIQAAKDCNVDIIRNRLSEAGAGSLTSIREPLTGKTLLMIATGPNCHDVVDILVGVSSLVYINLADNNGDTALIAYIKIGYNEGIRKLLTVGADVNISNNEGNTAFLLACRKFDNLEIVRLLVEQGAEYRIQGEGGFTRDVTNRDGCSALHLASKYWGNLNTVRYLVALGSDITKRLPDGTTPCQLARRNGDSRVCNFIEAHTANPQNLFIESILNRCDIDGLIDARIRAGGAESLAKIRETSTGKTLLILASEKGCISKIRSLTKALQSEYINLSDEEGNTALITAVKRDTYFSDEVVKVVKILRQSGAHINVLNKKGNSALLEASKIGRLSCVQLLLELGADPNIKGDEGLTPLEIAINRNTKNVVELLKDHMKKRESDGSSFI